MGDSQEGGSTPRESDKKSDTVDRSLSNDRAALTGCLEVGRASITASALSRDTPAFASQDGVGIDPLGGTFDLCLLSCQRPVFMSASR